MHLLTASNMPNKKKQCQWPSSVQMYQWWETPPGPAFSSDPKTGMLWTPADSFHCGDIHVIHQCACQGCIYRYIRAMTPGSFTDQWTAPFNIFEVSETKNVLSSYGLINITMCRPLEVSWRIPRFRSSPLWIIQSVGFVWPTKFLHVVEVCGLQILYLYLQIGIFQHYWASELSCVFCQAGQMAAWRHAFQTDWD